MKILFIQHAGALGGSTYSLLLLMRGLARRGYRPEVALVHPAADVRGLYADEGFPVHDAPRIGIFAHTTGGWAHLRSVASIRQFMNTLYRWRSGQEATIRLVQRVNPDLVHLNSVVLCPSAIALRKEGVPFVWHVRECPPFQGARTSFIRRHLLNSPQVIFLSEYDRRQWTKSTHGTILPNSVDFSKIDEAPTRNEARKLLGLGPVSPVVLYLGGVVMIKGFHVLLEAALEVVEKRADALFLMPGSEIRLAERGLKRTVQRILPYFNMGTGAQRVLRFIRENGLEHSVRLLPFAKDVMPYFAACDVLVFPSVLPHFARPVIEASAFGKPVIGSDIGGVRELIEPGRTGILCRPGDPEDLASGILRLLNDREGSVRIGAAARETASRMYGADRYLEKIIAIYNQTDGM
ncbi:MAG: glycosyltransferase family 4 protein [Syntrophobacteraceae bacterium]